ncbi:tetratricopeptide repeat protein [Flaviaesturariibacter flavus]|uniref:Tetratricopeptide repeat protein n=1 Tax=Flaviaesturariibacter flavus TaxID=2502780 RepID=A0A4R1BB21_9BACT|nr:tetratricopeptide repeat protein [Flaviaesturariibacter flavus]TCJ14154.1 tetratricopeptide repeat protein [Flaviaesturariibacter flavus]
MRILPLLLLLLATLGAGAQQDAIRAGNAAYRNGDWTMAESQYRRAGENPVAQYNLANALIKQNRYDEALAILAPLTLAGDASLREKAFYNTGVVYSKQKAIEQSIDAYKSALRLAPYDKEARDNLQKALSELKQGGGGGGGQDKNSSNADKKLKDLQDKERKLQQARQDKGGGNKQSKDW